MNLKRWDIWSADLNPRMGTEPGKIRPVLIIQTDLLNGQHPSTIICPLSTNIHEKSDILRVHLEVAQGGLHKRSDILIDQIRAIDNQRLKNKLGECPIPLRKKIIENLNILLDLTF